ncbi:hypothetical protein OJ253_736 [Cryptosporidium canis]|uniref:Uncharacterized protein n=1 Tax=Cryptosporidium canis TaxID=195482 RepID=A0A9D5DIM9_9CRYT|nr:hypothetical protein OJ253_736 [Cryptosporidium canis]
MQIKVAKEEGEKRLVSGFCVGRDHFNCLPGRATDGGCLSVLGWRSCQSDPKSGCLRRPQPRARREIPVFLGSCNEKSRIPRAAWGSCFAPAGGSALGAHVSECGGLPGVPGGAQSRGGSPGRQSGGPEEDEESGRVCQVHGERREHSGCDHTAEWQVEQPSGVYLSLQREPESREQRDGGILVRELWGTLGLREERPEGDQGFPDKGLSQGKDLLQNDEEAARHGEPAGISLKQDALRTHLPKPGLGDDGVEYNPRIQGHPVNGHPQGQH